MARAGSETQDTTPALVVYHGCYDGTVVRHEGEKLRKLNPRLDLFNHSPTGFAWGYGGSGPAQLALALLADVLGNDDRAVHLHQDFKRNVVAHLEFRSPWMLTRDQVLLAIAELEGSDG